MASFFGLGGSLKIDVVLDGPISSGSNNHQQEEANPNIIPLSHSPSWRLRKNPFWRVNGNNNNNKTIVPSNELGKPLLYAYEASQDISGKVLLTLPPGKSKVDHLGLKIQFIGRIDMGVNEGRPHYDFISLSKELSPPSSIYQSSTEIPFTFKNMDKEHESYVGRNVSVRYFIKVLMERKFLPPVTKEQDVFIQSLGTPPESNNAIKMEVGIEDCLHIEFEYAKRAFHLQDIIVGNIHFLLVRIKIKYMELAVIRRETSGEGVAALSSTAAGGGGGVQQQQNAQNIFTETQTLVKHEIMDGCPFAKDIIPVKLHLEGIPADLTPTYTAENNNRFTVRYYLNLVLVDEEDRRYFKQQEIILWRKELGG